MNLLTGT